MFHPLYPFFGQLFAELRKSYLDKDLKVVWVNQAIERYFDLRREEVIGQNKREIIRERIKYIFEEPEAFVEKVGATYDDNTYAERFECHVLPDGERKERWLEHRSMPIRSGLFAGGRIEHYYDITVQKQAPEQLHQMAITDSLTGLFNRRHFFTLAEKELARTKRYMRLLSIIIFDIDHFKHVNDTFGHAAGDKALYAITEKCQESLRKNDIFARYGGEEFVVLLPETDLPKAYRTVERLRQAISQQPIETEAGAIFITASMGVTSLDDNTLILDKLLARADKALYIAKEDGRNKVSVWPNTDPQV